MDDFQRAAEAARSRIKAEAWDALPVQAQAREIYAELRRIDAEKSTPVPAQQKRRTSPRRATLARAERHVAAHAA
jgi:hypothetical protein